MITLRNAIGAGDAGVELAELGPCHRTALTALEGRDSRPRAALDRIFELAQDEARATDGDCAAVEKSGCADFDLRPPIIEAAWNES